MKVPIPPASEDTVVPPIPRHPQGYFWRAGENPFDARATGFSVVNAWWLAEAALLAYDNEGAVRGSLPAGWELVRFFQGESTQAYVAGNSEAVIAAFRCT